MTTIVDIGRHFLFDWQIEYDQWENFGSTQSDFWFFTKQVTSSGGSYYIQPLGERWTLLEIGGRGDNLWERNIDHFETPLQAMKFASRMEMELDKAMAELDRAMEEEMQDEIG